MLFFAQFFDHVHNRCEESKKPPVCCPIQDYHAFPGEPAAEPVFFRIYDYRHELIMFVLILQTGRCFICESGSVRIVHPPCGTYFMGNLVPTDDLCAVAEHHADLGQ
jgi:hypothetical protein